MMLERGTQHGQSHKKVGMRFIFPPLSDELTLLEKAQIWVARHNYKYFVNWTDDQLRGVDNILQPVVPVTPSLYKTHMNRWGFGETQRRHYVISFIIYVLFS